MPDKMSAKLSARGGMSATMSNGGGGGGGGQPGPPGFSPIANVTKSGDTATITITDKTGTTTAQVKDGTNGQPGTPGQDGYSPTASVSKSGNTATISITDKNGTTTAQISDGAPGTPGSPGNDGDDGITPDVTVTSITGGHNVAFDYGTGDSRNTDFDVMDGVKGDTGDDGITPEVTVTGITGGHNVAFSYGSGDSRNTDFDVLDGDASGCVSQEDFDELKTDFEELKEEIHGSLTEVVPDSTQTGYLYYYSGKKLQAAANGKVKKVTIDPDYDYYVTTSLRSSGVQFPLISYFDSNDDFISYEFPNVAGETVSITKEKLTIPQTAVWFYVNSRYEESVIYKTDDAIDLHELADTVKAMKLDKEISVLFIGNSLTQDGIAYLPYVLKTYYPNVLFRFYIWYHGGYTLGEHYTDFVNDVPGYTFSVAENTAAWTNYSSTKTMADVLDTYTFDIVCMQEYLNHRTAFEVADLVDWENCKAYITDNYTGGNGLEFVTLFHAPLRSAPNSIFELTKKANNLILQNTIAEDMIGTGIAIYRALDTALDNLGDQGHLSPDGTHTQEGLPCLLQTYVALLWLFDRLGINESVYGLPMRMTTAIYETLDVPGPNLGTGVITGTDAENLLAQEVAIQAFKESKEFVTKTKTASVVDDVSKLSDVIFTGKMTLTESDFEEGSWAYSAKSTSGKRLRSKVLFPVKAGYKVKFSNPSFKVYFGTLLTKSSSSYTSPSGWLAAGQTDAEYTIPIDGYTNIILESDDDSDVSLVDYDCSIVVEVPTLTAQDKQDIVDDVVDEVGVKTESVSGTTPTITGVANTRYICGEVSTISITPPQSGIIDVIFTSGSSVAVLTVPSTVKWPSGFDPTSLETNTTYELNILDGVYGAVMTWT